MIHHNPARAMKAAGLCQVNVGLHAGRQHHARRSNTASIEQRHGIVVNCRDAGGKLTAHAPFRQRLLQQRASLLIQLLFHQPRTAMNERDVVT